MNVKGIDALAEELGPWIVNMAAKPYDGSTEAELFCPFHEHPEHSNKPSATWQPKAKSSSPRFDLGVFHCHRPGCHLPAEGEDVRDNWQEAQALREQGVELPDPMSEGSADVIDMGAWKPGGGKDVKAKPSRKGKAKLEAPIDGETWDVYQEFLYDDAENVGYMLRERGLTADTLRKYEWAWHQGKECYIYPVYRLDGEVEGWRLYDPFHLKDGAYKARDKKRWFRTREHHHNQLWGLKQHDGSDIVILWEGETDTMLANQDGITNGITHTGGAGFWGSHYKPWFRGKTVYTCYDPDSAGQAGREKVSQELKGSAAGVFHIDMPDGLDYSEWRKAGNDPEAFAQLMEDAKEAWTGEPEDDGSLPTEGVPLKSVGELKDVTSDKVVALRAYVAGKREVPWRLPKIMEVSCRQNKDNKTCSVCPMFTGTLNTPSQKDFPISPAKDDSLVAMMNASDEDVNKLLIRELELRCKSITMEAKEDWHVEQVSIQDPVDTSDGISGDTRYSAYHFYEGTGKIEGGHDYRLVARRLSDPRTQALAIVAWGAERTTTDLDTYRINTVERIKLQRFRPRKEGLGFLKAALARKYRDLSVNVTKIAGRPDLHLLYDLVAHSVSEFDFNNKHVKRGMLDCLVIGDTRTGKSEMVQALNTHYGIGVLVSGENSSFAGLVGGSAEISGSRERMPSWGVLPRHHKRMVVIDEVSGLGDLLAKMSSVRSSGRAEVQKQGGGEAPAMVRLLWLGNPVPHDRSNQTRSISKYRSGAIGAISDLIKMQEDIARFDVAMTAVSEDVSEEDIYTHRGQTTAHHYTGELCHSMAMFAWTRKRNQVEFADGVVEVIQDVSKGLASTYISQPPLIQGSNVDEKVAKMAVSLATMMYSTSLDGETVVVLPEHVEFIDAFIRRCYDHENFGYGRASSKEHEFARRSEGKEDALKEWLKGGKPDEFKHQDEITGDGFAGLIEHFDGSFSIREFRDMTDQLTSSTLIPLLQDMGMLYRQSGRYHASTALMRILREIEEER